MGEKEQNGRLANENRPLDGMSNPDQAIAVQLANRLAALSQLGKWVTTQQDISKIYAGILGDLRQLLRAETTLIFLHDQDELIIIAENQERPLAFLGQRIPVGAGIAGEVWRTGQPTLRKGNACRTTHYRPLADMVGYAPQVIMGALIRWQGEAIGVLEAVHRDSAAFMEEDLQLLETAAIWTGVAIGNSRQYKLIERQLEESKMLAKISTMLNETLDIDQLMRLIVESANRIMPQADWTAVHLIDRAASCLQPKSVTHVADDLTSYRLPLTGNPLAKAIVEERILNLTQFANTTQSLPPENPWRNVQSLLIAPIQRPHRVIGVLSATSILPNAFSAADERLMATLAAQAALALENARLFRAQEHARKTAETQHRRLRRLNRQLVSAQETERQRLSRELHDEAGQSLTALKITLDLIRGSLPASEAHAQESLQDAIQLTDQTMENIRLISYNLRPPALDKFGLDTSLQGYCREFSHRTGLPVAYEGNSQLPKLSDAQAITLYRVVQEALTNVAKHARATQAKVMLTYKSGLLTVKVIDDGVGFHFSSEDSTVFGAVNGIGLIGMRERLELLDGELWLRQAKQGARLIAHLPVDEDGEDD